MDYAIVDSSTPYSRAAIRTGLVDEIRMVAQELGATWLKPFLARAGVTMISEMTDLQIMGALADVSSAAGPLTVAEMARDYQARAAADADFTETMDMLGNAIFDRVLQPAAASH